ncbi:MAG: porin [Bacteroidia bacterium]
MRLNACSTSLLLFLLSFTSVTVVAQSDTAKLTVQKALEKVAPPQVKKSHWYDKIQLRGYTQVRYNRLLETNPDLKFEGDRSVGDKGGALIRRGRLIFFGDITSHLFLYYQVDFASNASSTNLHFGQVRDLYADIYVDTGKVFRFRVGQSKVPFGFENMQSSQNRMALDRADALNTAVPSERDLGAFFYWTPRKARARYDYLGDKGLKGSNNYGVFGFGVYNGQSTNKPELNNSLHTVARLSYPFGFGKQILEVGVQGYTGFFTLESGQATGGVKKNSTSTYRDKRAAVSIALAPQPFGLLAEYNIGESPMYDVNKDSIVTAPLEGGFITAYYMIKLPKVNQTLVPYVRAQYYSGGVKIATDTKALKMNEYDFGIEYQIMKSLEITTCYVYSVRNTSDKAKEFYNQTGNLMRIQVQFNY